MKADIQRNCTGTAVLPYSLSGPESTQIGAWVWDVVADAVYSTFRLACILGLPIEAIGKGMASMRSHVYSADIAKVKRHMECCLCRSDGWHEEEFRLVSQNGDIIRIHEFCIVTKRSSDGNPAFVAGFLRNKIPHMTNFAASAEEDCGVIGGMSMEFCKY